MPDSDVSRFLAVLLEREGACGKKTAKDLAEQFSTLASFKETDFKTATFTHSGDGKKIRIRERTKEKAEEIKKYINPNVSLPENWIKFTIHRTTHKFLDNISELSLDKINMNPFLIRALNLKTPKEVIRFNAYQTITRSIVTSMGTALEYMVGNSGARMGKKGEWYDVVKKIDKSTYWIQVKSGPNNINKDQLEKFAENFAKTEEEENQYARLGIVYGKRDLNTVSIGLVKKYLKNWKKQLLVGSELWKFVSREKNYHVKVLKWIDEVATEILRNKSIDGEISQSISKLTREFEEKYGCGRDGVQKYLAESL